MPECQSCNLTIDLSAFCLDFLLVLWNFNVQVNQHSGTSDSGSVGLRHSFIHVNIRIAAVVWIVELDLHWKKFCNFPEERNTSWVCAVCVLNSVMPVFRMVMRVHAVLVGKIQLKIPASHILLPILDFCQCRPLKAAVIAQLLKFLPPM